jgi:hypothetical protein
MGTPTIDGDRAVLSPVLYVSDGLAPILDVRGRRYTVPKHLWQEGTTISAPGDLGTLVLSSGDAQVVGLTTSG